ncbi:MAG: TetR/AcrR family transcriptional regulator [Caldilineaceae bacterium]
MTISCETTTSKAGRPRSPETHQAIIEATLELVARDGIQGTSIEAIAAQAGVGKTAIYRRWATKEALVLDALNELHAQVPIVDSGNIHKDLVSFLSDLFHQIETHPLLKGLILRVLGEAKERPEFLQTLVARFYTPRRQQWEKLFAQAQQRGELRSDMDIGLAVSMIMGPAFFHLLTSQISPTAYTMRDLPERLVDVVLHGVGARQ